MKSKKSLALFLAGVTLVSSTGYYGVNTFANDNSSNVAVVEEETATSVSGVEETESVTEATSSIEVNSEEITEATTNEEVNTEEITTTTEEETTTPSVQFNTWFKHDNLEWKVDEEGNAVIRPASDAIAKGLTKCNDNGTVNDTSDDVYYVSSNVNTSSSEMNWKSEPYASYIKHITFETNDGVKLQPHIGNSSSDCEQIFSNLKYVESIDFSNTYLKATVKFTGAVLSCSNLTSFKFGDNVDTSSLVTLDALFSFDYELISIDMGSADLSKVTDFGIFHWTGTAPSRSFDYAKLHYIYLNKDMVKSQLKIFSTFNNSNIVCLGDGTEDFKPVESAVADILATGSTIVDNDLSKCTNADNNKITYFCPINLTMCDIKVSYNGVTSATKDSALTSDNIVISYDGYVFDSNDYKVTQEKKSNGLHITITPVSKKIFKGSKVEKIAAGMILPMVETSSTTIPNSDNSESTYYRSYRYFSDKAQVFGNYEKTDFISTDSNGKSQVVYTKTYYTDRACTQPTTILGDGAATVGGAPVYAGNYFIKLTANYKNTVNKSITDNAIPVERTDFFLMIKPVLNLSGKVMEANGKTQYLDLSILGISELGTQGLLKTNKGYYKSYDRNIASKTTVDNDGAFMDGKGAAAPGVYYVRHNVHLKNSWYVTTSTARNMILYTTPKITTNEDCTIIRHTNGYYGEDTSYTLEGDTDVFNVTDPVSGKEIPVKIIPLYEAEKYTMDVDNLPTQNSDGTDAFDYTDYNPDYAYGYYTFYNEDGIEVGQMEVAQMKPGDTRFISDSFIYGTCPSLMGDYYVTLTLVDRVVYRSVTSEMVKVHVIDPTFWLE